MLFLRNRIHFALVPAVGFRNPDSGTNDVTICNILASVTSIAQSKTTHEIHENIMLYSHAQILATRSGANTTINTHQKPHPHINSTHPLPPFNPQHTQRPSTSSRPPENATDHRSKRLFPIP